MNAAVAVGTAFGLAIDLGDAQNCLVVPALIGLLALTFAGINGRSFTSGIRPRPETAMASLGINILGTSDFGGVIGRLLPDQPDLRLIAVVSSSAPSSNSPCWRSPPNRLPQEQLAAPVTPTV